MTAGQRVAGMVSSLRETRRRMGGPNAVLYVLGRLLARASADRIRLIKYLIVAQPIGAAQLAAMRPDPNVVVALTPRDSELVDAFPRPIGVVRRRFDSGALCFSALVKNTFAGYIWLRHDAYEEDEVRCTFVLDDPSRSVWDFDVYVEPKYRIGRTMARLWSAVDHYLGERGIAWSFSRISAFNPDSLAAHTRLGIVPCHSAVFVVMGSWQLAFLPQRPYVHLSTSERQRPSLRLRLPLSR